MEYIATPTAGEILREEFMEPFHLSVYELARQIHVPVSHIQEILNDTRRITADTSLRFAKFFGVSDSYFSHIQIDIEKRKNLIRFSVIN